MNQSVTPFQSLVDLCAEILDSHPEFTPQQRESIIDHFLSLLHADITLHWEAVSQASASIKQIRKGVK